MDKIIAYFFTILGIVGMSSAVAMWLEHESTVNLMGIILIFLSGLICTMGWSHELRSYRKAQKTTINKVEP